MLSSETLKKKWRGKNPLDVGRQLFEIVPPEKRPAWAANILSHATTWVRHIPEIDYVLAIARDPKEWGKGHIAFDHLRDLTLEAQEELIECLLLLAENTAKVIYNETNPEDPFDSDSGWWISENLWAITAIINDDEFEKEAWGSLNTIPTS